MPLVSGRKAIIDFFIVMRVYWLAGYRGGATD
jgi:hypothetical protein